MKQMKQQFVDSWHELRHLKTVVVTAMLIAVWNYSGIFFHHSDPVSENRIFVYCKRIDRLLLLGRWSVVSWAELQILSNISSADGIFFGFTHERNFRSCDLWNHAL